MAHFLLIPAAGRGERFGADQPKQYIELAGLPIIEQTLLQLTGLRHFDAIQVGLAAQDPGWTSAIAWTRVTGGDSRAATVLALLESLAGRALDDDWVWVHDAVRPLVSRDVMTLLDGALESGADAVLPGVPVADTLKQVGADGRVERTLDRSTLWCAQTPQVCRYGKLLRALRAALAEGWEVTDEAMAMEQAGHRVQIVTGSATNIKITRPADLRLAATLFPRRGD